MVFFLILFFILEVFGGEGPLWAETASSSFHLRILYTNDTHGHLLPFRQGTHKKAGGIAQRATLIKKLGGKRPEVLVLDAGDVYSRSDLFPLFRGRAEVEAMNLAGYEAMCLGNGEFYNSLPELKKRIAEARFPILSANVRDKGGEYIAKPYVVYNLCGVRVGLFGLTAPRIMFYPQVQGQIMVEDPFLACRRMVRFLRPRVDILIALTHLTVWMDEELARSFPELDVIVGGDSHTRLNPPLILPKRGGSPSACGLGIPIVQAGEYGLWLGKLDLYFQREEPGLYCLSHFEAELIPITEAIPPDPKVERAVQRYYRLRELAQKRARQTSNLRYSERKGRALAKRMKSRLSKKN